MTSQPGWGIIERDLIRYQQSVIGKLAYLSPKRPEFFEARLLYIGIDKLLALINDYEVNRDKAIELLDKIQNPDLAVTLDVDNEV